MVTSRYGTKEEATRTLNAYLEGAKYGVVGHFTSYPLSVPNLNFDPLQVIKTQLLNHTQAVGLYIHWPFCYLPFGLEKCDFCMCNTKNDAESVSLRKEYFDALVKEIKIYSNILDGKSVEWVYFGGGTPLTMTVNELEEIFRTLTDNRVINKNTYISIESRPEVVTQKKIDVLKRFNVTRLSMGVESFQEDTVVAMGRIRKGLDYYNIVSNAVTMVREAGIPYFNLDFIYSHPLDELSTVIDSIQKALDFEPDSLSIYPLGLPFNRTSIEKDVINGTKLKTLDFRYECYKEIDSLLKEHGYTAVSDSIWSRNEMYSHKTVLDKGVVNFWNQTCMVPHGIWLGVGVGSIGFIEGYGPTNNTYSIPQYIEMVNDGKVGMIKGCESDLEELMRGYIVISFLHRIIDIKNFEEKFKINPLIAFQIEFDLLKELNFIEINEDEIALKAEAVPLSQGISRFFLSKGSDDKYRQSEKSRVDYSFYGISYKDLP